MMGQQQTSSINQVVATQERPVVARRGTSLRCRTWRAEALLRMLENVLEVGERPDDLVIYGSFGRCARNWEAFHTIVGALRQLREDQTLVLQSGAPVGVLTTTEDAPMVVSAVNNTVGAWATPERFYDRADHGRTIWGGLTAAAWQYIGRQGVLEGTYELLRAAAQQHFGGSRPQHLKGRWLLTAGLGGMGSSQPISARILGLSSVVVEVDPAKAERLLADGGLDTITSDEGEAVRWATEAAESGQTREIGLVGNAATVYARLARAGVTPSIVTDQTAAHDARLGYVPEGLTVEEWSRLRRRSPEVVEVAARRSMAHQVEAMLEFRARGAVAFENGNNLRIQAAQCPEGPSREQAFEIPGFMDAYLRPLFCRGIGPFRWVALSGDARDLKIVDDLASDMFPQRPEVAEWLRLAREHVPQQGLPARSCWLGHGERSRLAVAVNEAVADGRLSAPVAFSRDHLDSAGMTHPLIGTEGMRDGSDGVADWPLLDAVLLLATGADLVAIHSGGGGYSGWMQSAGVTVVADGAAGTSERLTRSLDADTGLGVLRHATAGYDEAVDSLHAGGETGDVPLEWFGSFDIAGVVTPEDDGTRHGNTDGRAHA